MLFNVTMDVPHQSLSFHVMPHDFMLPVNEMSLSKSEKETLYFVAGYVAFTIKRSFKYKCTPEAKCIDTILKQWGNTEDTNTDDVSFTQYVKGSIEVDYLLLTWSFICLSSSSRNMPVHF